MPRKTKDAADAPAARVPELFRQIMKARTRVYRLFPPTPTEVHAMPGGWTMLLKREDLSEIHSYKWRGAFNFMAAREKEARLRGVVAASAGNHAQGVAVSAARLGVKAVLFMPKSAPRLKVDSVARLGGGLAEIRLEGDTFDDAQAAALAHSDAEGSLMVPPYDDLLVMAGQGVVGDEIMTSPERPHAVYVQIGGGGLAAGVAAVVKTYDPAVRVIGVEAEGQASMSAAFEAGSPVTLPRVDIFCDGTAVKTAGTLTFGALKGLLDGIVTVTAAEVASAMEELWRAARVISEPSGAMGLAAARRDEREHAGRKVGIILSGANLDFRRLGNIARRAGDPSGRQACYQVELPERPGALLAFLKTIAPAGLNISHLMVGQYGADLAYPVVGFDGSGDEFGYLEELMSFGGYKFQDITGRPDIPFRVAPYQPSLLRLPFAAILHFPERPGALTEFLERVAALANISYFNYVHSGEQVGRALAVFSFETEASRASFLEGLKSRGPEITPLPRDTNHALGLEASRGKIYDAFAK
ncbi:MAG: pyridoxal-phosphate dependent enzyme [Deltaproteobacteria bacterium]|jgi:threonine dehydratase|nr:pyridoxal-phosphate dependent enzyme [Deltaproteobacteria bacterium]